MFVENSFIKTDSGNTNPLNKPELKILQTAFFMAHKLNQEKKDYDSSTEFVIRLKDFADLWVIEDSEKRLVDGSLYTMLRRAIKKVDSRRFEYLDISSDNGKKTEVFSGYFNYLKLVSSKDSGSEIVFSFPQPLIPYLKNHGQFTWYYFENTIKLQDYPNAIILYELFSKDKNYPQKKITKTQLRLDFTIDSLRKRLSVADGYDNTDLVRKILKPAIEKINQLTNLEVNEQPIIVKKGRTIESIGFEVKFSESDLNFARATKALNDKKPFLTDLLILKFATSLCRDTAFISVYKKDNEDTIDFVDRISSDLRDNVKVIEYYEYLKRVGLANKRIASKISQIVDAP